MESYRRLGIIPSATLSDVFYRTESFYEDPVAVWAALSDPAAGESQGYAGYAGDLPCDGDIRDQYFGSVLLREGVAVGRLNGTQTQLLNLIKGSTERFSLECGGGAAAVRRMGSVRVDINDEATEITVRLSLDAAVPRYGIGTSEIASFVTEQLESMTALCQSLKVEPFGYAGSAIARFATVDEWLAYGWRERFSQADVRYEVTVTLSDA